MAPVVRIGDGVYRIERDGRHVVVYVGGEPGDLWAFCDGEVYRERERAATHSGPRSLAAPMPATVLAVSVTPGQTVRHGDTLVVLEAMKMELPLKAPCDATVKAVHCHAGELVPPDRVLVELE